MDFDGGLKRKDTTKGPPLRILSLDGGGVRGYSMIIILQELMHRTYVEIEGRAPRRAEIPKPCDHFDLIVGTGTGGLIALMLGRLRLDLEQCKELYVRMTRMVFETDKTIAGIPYRSTLFKASMLEQAIKEAVREHTVDEEEGNDSTPSIASPLSAGSKRSSGQGVVRRHASNASVVSFSAKSPTAQMARPAWRGSYGDPDAKLYDLRENRTKTALTAMYKGTQIDRKTGLPPPPAMLRSYDSRKEPPPEYDCTIWEAGRATCAIGPFFKPIRVGQSLFDDDGPGRFNPAEEALEEATVNEWPGREVGVFVSVGTGKRQRGQDAAKAHGAEHLFGDWVEAKNKLIKKIENCEVIHKKMRDEHLMKHGVNVENYFRLNVEMGVGDYGMNEWHRLSEISTGTRRYMSRPEEQKLIQDSSTRLAKIYRAKQRYEKMGRIPEITSSPPMNMDSMTSPLAVELPGDMPTMFPTQNTPSSRQSYDSGLDHLSFPESYHGHNTPSPRSSGERQRPMTSSSTPPPPPPPKNVLRKPASHAALSSSSKTIPEEPDRLIVTAPTPAQYRHASGSDKMIITSFDEYPRRQANESNTKPVTHDQKPYRIDPPPLPPKTPLPENQLRRPGTFPPPYPMDEDAPPPVVNMARKPDFRGRT